MHARPAPAPGTIRILPSIRRVAFGLKGSFLGTIVAALLAFADPASAQTYLLRVADGNQSGLTTTNYGYFGNRFLNPSPSLEYPLGSGYEHLVHGGVWIGARAVDEVGSFTGVVTAALDATVGGNPAPQTEFTPRGSIEVRSLAPASPYYSSEAVSDLDLLSTYDDLVPRSTPGSTEPHRPMGVSVRQHVYQWASDGLESMVFVRLIVSNAGDAPLSDVWVGLYTELASGSKNAYSCWPPSTSCGPGSWYRKKWISFDAPSRLLREHYCAALPVPGGCNLAAVPPWMGLQLLTPPGAGQTFTVAAWPWGPSDPLRDQDVERHGLMSAGTIADFALPELSPQSGDPVEMIALGPFGSVSPGDSVEVSFAFIGAADEASLSQLATLAQQVHDLGYRDPTTPALVALISAAASQERVTLTWAGHGPSPFATVERADASAPETAGQGAPPSRDLAAIQSDASGRFTFDDDAVTPGASYDYRLRFTNGERTASTRVDVPRAAAFAIDAVRPNPSSGSDPVVSFSLDRSGPARLEAVDLTGRRVSHVEFHGTAGRHLHRLDGGERLAPGIYLLRLTQAGRTASTRLTVIR